MDLRRSIGLKYYLTRTRDTNLPTTFLDITPISLSAVSGTLRREFRGMLDARATEPFRYSDLKEDVMESSSYVF